MRRLGKGVGVGLLGLVVTGMTLWGIRNIAYRTATDCTPRYDDKTFDLLRLDSAAHSGWPAHAPPDSR